MYCTKINTKCNNLIRRLNWAPLQSIKPFQSLSYQKRRDIVSIPSKRSVNILPAYYGELYKHLNNLRRLFCVALSWIVRE